MEVKKPVDALDEEQADDSQLRVRQVCCGSVNSVLLLTSGEVYVTGDNSFGQQARDPAK